MFYERVNLETQHFRKRQTINHYLYQSLHIVLLSEYFTVLQIAKISILGLRFFAYRTGKLFFTVGFLYNNDIRETCRKVVKNTFFKSILINVIIFSACYPNLAVNISPSN